MIKTGNLIESDDPFNLTRFIEAQRDSYDNALAELQRGTKRTHWMWYIFPQIHGLGRSADSRLYGIKSLEEAQRYLDHPILGVRLLKCTEAVLKINGRTVSEIFGYPDDLKFKSSMTLFECASNSGSLFTQALEKYFNGERDQRTHSLLENLTEKSK
jgi:uncharacterized protein (DUF1810 family)